MDVCEGDETSDDEGISAISVVYAVGMGKAAAEAFRGGESSSSDSVTSVIGLFLLLESRGRQRLHFHVGGCSLDLLLRSEVHFL